MNNLSREYGINIEALAKNFESGKPGFSPTTPQIPYGELGPTGPGGTYVYSSPTSKALGGIDSKVEEDQHRERVEQSLSRDILRTTYLAPEKPKPTPPVRQAAVVDSHSVSGTKDVLKASNDNEIQMLKVARDSLDKLTSIDTNIALLYQHLTKVDSGGAQRPDNYNQSGRGSVITPSSTVDRKARYS